MSPILSSKSWSIQVFWSLAAEPHRLYAQRTPVLPHASFPILIFISKEIYTAYWELISVSANEKFSHCQTFLLVRCLLEIDIQCSASRVCEVLMCLPCFVRFQTSYQIHLCNKFLCHSAQALHSPVPFLLFLGPVWKLSDVHLIHRISSAKQTCMSVNWFPRSVNHEFGSCDLVYVLYWYPDQKSHEVKSMLINYMWIWWASLYVCNKVDCWQHDVNSKDYSADRT